MHLLCRVYKEFSKREFQTREEGNSDVLYLYNVNWYLIECRFGTHLSTILFVVTTHTNHISVDAYGDTSYLQNFYVKLKSHSLLFCILYLNFHSIDATASQVHPAK